MAPVEFCPHEVDRLILEDGRTIEASIIDSGAVYLFVCASDVGLRYASKPLDTQEQANLIRIAEDLRSQAAVIMGLVQSRKDAASLSPNVPKVAFVSEPLSTDIDLLARIVSSQSLHNAYAVTGAIATVSAAAVPDSIVNRLVGRNGPTSPLSLRIGHPTGVIDLRIDWRSLEDRILIDRAYTVRTARRLMSGLVYVPAELGRREFVAGVL